MYSKIFNDFNNFETLLPISTSTSVRPRTSSQTNGLQIIEGPLSKWTNVMQGWQCRWFVLDQSSGLLSYYTSRQKMRLGVRRGCIRLINGKACIGLDDEDKNVFTITDLAVDKTFHFMTKDHEERSFWLKHLEETIKLTTNNYTNFNSPANSIANNNAHHHKVLPQNNAVNQQHSLNAVFSHVNIPTKTQNLESFNQNQREIGALTRIIKTNHVDLTIDNSCASSTSSRNSKISAVLSAAEQSLNSLDFAMKNLSTRQSKNMPAHFYDARVRLEND